MREKWAIFNLILPVVSFLITLAVLIPEIGQTPNWMAGFWCLLATVYFGLNTYALAQD